MSHRVCRREMRQQLVASEFPATLKIRVSVVRFRPRPPEFLWKPVHRDGLRRFWGGLMGSGGRLRRVAEVRRRTRFVAQGQHNSGLLAWSCWRDFLTATRARPQASHSSIRQRVAPPRPPASRREQECDGRKSGSAAQTPSSKSRAPTHDSSQCLGPQRDRNSVCLCVAGQDHESKNTDRYWALPDLCCCRNAAGRGRRPPCFC